MSDSSEDLPPDVEDAATKAVSCLLPKKSKTKYEEAYKRFNEWGGRKGVKNIVSEKVLLAYFEELSAMYKPSSLWAFYSMVRAMLSKEKNVDISKYNQLIAFLKRKSEGYKPKKSKIFSKEEVMKFFANADDKEWLLLLIKTVLIMGLAGACRKEELKNLLFKNVRDEGQVFHLTIPTTKTKISREFFITCGGLEKVNMVEIVRKYIALRPSHTDHGRFYAGFRNGKCTIQPVGINTIGSMPKRIANFLKLPEAEEYTSHCFRRSSASLLADSGADLLTLKRHGGWRSSTVAEGYIETSSENKKRVASKILGEVKASTSTCSNKVRIVDENELTLTTSGINLKKCKNIVINVCKK